MKETRFITARRQIGHCGSDGVQPALDAFTLIELLVSMAVLGVMMILMVQILGATQRVYTDSQSKVEQFREARVAFEAVTRRISQATLNTYWDYNDPDKPTRYVRQSELHFICGPAEKLLNATGIDPVMGHAVFFQAPMGVAADAAHQQMATALNAWGYYLTCNSDVALEARPTFLGKRLAERTRCRLMEFRQATERMSVYSPPGGAPPGYRGLTTASFNDVTSWFNNSTIVRDDSTKPARIVSRPVAENIIALIVSPRSPIPPKATNGHDFDVAPQYYYDSRRFLVNGTSPLSELTRHQLPPMLQVTMVALDERSVSRYETKSRSTANLVDRSWFQTADAYDADLRALSERLVGERVNYQVFSTVVPIRGAKWSIATP